ncbi:MAG TPA: hypothetical protein VMW25_01485, partial [Clostridia bacterium]|nr:hypothetical protein [Clostridia bacterium]
EQRKTAGIVPTGKLDPTNPKEAAEIIELHKNFVRSDAAAIPVGGIFKTDWDKESNGFVVTSRDYTSEQVDTAYRTIQKSIPSPMPDTALFAMPGKEKELAAIAAKMQKQKGVSKVKKKGVRIAKPKALPKVATKPGGHIKAVFMATNKEPTRYAINGVLVEGENLVATDGRRMFVAKGKWGKDGIYLDRASLAKGLLGKVAKDAGKFPKWQDIIPHPDKADVIMVYDLEVVWRRVKQAASLTSVESKGVTILVNKDGSLGFSAAAPEIGHAEINIQPGAKVLGGANPQFLLDALAFHSTRGNDGFEFYFPDYNRPVLTKSFDGKTITLTMPVEVDVERASKALKEAIAPPPETKPKGGSPSGGSMAAMEGGGYGTIGTSEKKTPAPFTSDPIEPKRAKGEAGFAGMAGRPGGKTAKPWLDMDKVKSPDKEIEGFFGRTKRLPYSKKASKLLDKLKSGIRERFVFAHHLMKGKESALYRDMIRTLPEVRRRAGKKSIQDIIAVLDNDGTVQALDSAGLDLLRRKVFVQDILQEAKIDRSISGGFSLEQLEAETKRLDELIAKIPSVQKAYQARQKLWNDVSQDLLKRGVLDEDAAKNQYYVRHFVLDLAEKNRPTGFTRKKLSAPYRAYAKKRKGSVRDISTDYLEVEVRALRDIYMDNAIEDVANEIAEKANKRSFYTKQARLLNIEKAGEPPLESKGFTVEKWLKDKLGEKYVSPERLAEKDGYVEWHYKRPNLFYRAQTATESQMAAIIESSAEEAGEILKIPKSLMREALVLGRRKGWIIPDWLAAQLDDLPVNKRSNYVVRSFTKPFIQFWKRWILRVNPIRYNVRNQIGDTERLNTSGQTAAIKDIPEAVKVLITKNTPEYELMEKYGVVNSVLWHEMNDVSKVKDFERFKEKTTQRNFRQATLRAFTTPLRLASKIGNIEQSLTQFREDILRAAVFLNNYKKLQGGEKVRHWAGKIADIEEIAKTDKARAAAKISRETLGDYGLFTPFETDVLRQGFLPFYSWLKINTVFWPRVITNAAKEGTANKPIAIAATKLGINVSKWLISALWIYLAAHLWNHRDDKAKKKEESLPIWLRTMPHVNIGEKTIWGQTALSDFAEWADMENLASVYWRMDAGFLSKEEAALEASKIIAKAPVNKVYQALSPYLKAPITIISGQTTYPSVFEPTFVAKPASTKSLERAILDILGTDAKKFYQTAKGDRKFEDTLYAYFAGWWIRPTSPEELIEEIKQTKEWSSLKGKSQTTGRRKGEAKKGKERQWQETKIREKAVKELL